MIVNKLVDLLGLTGTNYKNKEYILQTSTTFSLAKLSIQQFKSYIHEVIEESELFKTTFMIDEHEHFQLQKKHFRRKHIQVLDPADGSLAHVERSILDDTSWLTPGGYLYKYIFVPLPASGTCNVYFIVHHSMMDGLGIFNMLNRLYLRTANIPYLATADHNHYPAFPNNLATHTFWEEKKANNQSLLHPANVEKLKTIEIDFSTQEWDVLKKSNLSVLTLMALARTYPIFYPEDYQRFAVDMALNLRAKEGWRDLGMFVNMVPLFFETWENLPLNKIEREIKLGIVQAFKHRAYEVNRLGESYANVLFSYLPLKDIVDPNLTDTLAINWLDTNYGPYDFSFTLFEKKEVVSLRLDYKKHKFAEEEMHAFLNLVKAYMLSLAQTPAERKKEKTLAQWEIPQGTTSTQARGKLPTKADFRTQIEKVFAKNSARIALKTQDQQLTFAQLAHNVVGYTRFLEDQGELEKIEAIFIDGGPSLESFTLMVTAIALGKPYIFTNQNLASNSLTQLENLFSETLWFSDQREQEGRQCLAFPPLVNSDQNAHDLSFKEAEHDLLTYFCTSGTTGQPKIIPVKRSSVYHLICNEGNPFMAAHDVSLLVASVTFDLTLDPIYRTFLNHGTLVIVDQNKLFDPVYLAELIDVSKADTLLATPSVLTELGDQIYLKLKKVGGVGEAFLLPLAQRLLNFPGLSVYNCYGPTEATCYSHVFPLVKGEVLQDLSNVPIGNELAQMETVVVDPFNCPLPHYLTGELLLFGAGVFDGYKHSQEHEAVFQTIAGKHFYATGDLGYFDGKNYHYRQRKGTQIKLNGYRIELAAIEAVLQQYFSKKYKVVVLDAFIVLFYEEDLVEKDLLEKIAKKLPPYMIPRTLIKLPALPLNKNQKIDLEALRHLFDQKRQQTLEQDLSPLEQEVFQAFAQVLGMTNFSKAEKLYQLGGNSLMAIQISNLLKESWPGIEFDTVMREQSVAQIARFLANQTDKQQGTFVFKRKHHPCYQASQMQRAMILKSIMQKQDTSYIIGALIPLAGQQVELEKIKDLVNTKKDLHFNALYKDQTFFMAYQPDFTLIERQLELRDIDEIKEQIRPFDIFNEPLVRLTTIRLKKQAAFLLFEMHHLIGDGQTLIQLLKELAGLTPPASLAVPFAEALAYLSYQREALPEAIMATQLAQLSKGTPSSFQTTTMEETIQATFYFDSVAKEKIDRLKEQTAVSLQTLFSVWIIQHFKRSHKLAEAQDYIIGTPVSLRETLELEHTLGPLIQMLPYVVSATSSETDFATTQKALTNAIAAKYIAYDEWVEKLGKELFQIVITSFHDYGEISGLNIDDSLPLYGEKFGCSIYIYETDNGIRLVISTNILTQNELAEIYQSCQKEIERMSLRTSGD